AAVGGDHLAERDRAPVAELPCPVAELVAAVARSVGLHSGEHAIPAKNVCRSGAGDAEKIAQVVRPGEQPRLGDRGRVYTGVSRVADLTRHVGEHRVRGQIAHESVLDSESLEW